MKNRLIAVVVGLVLLTLAAPHKAAACERCGPVGFVCNADYCDYVVGCVGVQVGRAGGANECYSDFLGCYTTGGFCQWASMVSPQDNLQLLQLRPPALACHEAHS
jgi:hypothetical protein